MWKFIGTGAAVLQSLLPWGLRVAGRVWQRAPLPLQQQSSPGFSCSSSEGTATTAVRLYLHVVRPPWRVYINLALRWICLSTHVRVWMLTQTASPFQDMVSSGTLICTFYRMPSSGLSLPFSSDGNRVPLCLLSFWCTLTCRLNVHTQARLCCALLRENSPKSED